jgi:hypothetical protein
MKKNIKTIALALNEIANELPSLWQLPTMKTDELLKLYQTNNNINSCIEVIGIWRSWLQARGIVGGDHSFRSLARIFVIIDLGYTDYTSVTEEELLNIFN